MKHGLTRSRAAVSHHAKIVQSLQTCDALADHHQVAEEDTIGVGSATHIDNLTFWNDQYMRRSDRVDVTKCEGFVVLVDDVGVGPPRDDLAENAGHGLALQDFPRMRPATDGWRAIVRTMRARCRP